MAERIITDASGRRWDVTQDATLADPEHVRREAPLRFRRQTGEFFETPAPRPLDQMTDDELLGLLDRIRTERGALHVDDGGPDLAQDPAGYIAE